MVWLFVFNLVVSFAFGLDGDPRNPPSISQFCRQTAEAYQNYNLELSSAQYELALNNIRNKDHPDLKSFYKNYISSKKDYKGSAYYLLSPWRYSLHPDEKVRWLAIERALMISPLLYEAPDHRIYEAPDGSYHQFDLNHGPLNHREFLSPLEINVMDLLFSNKLTQAIKKNQGLRLSNLDRKKIKRSRELVNYQGSNSHYLSIGEFSYHIADDLLKKAACIYFTGLNLGGECTHLLKRIIDYVKPDPSYIPLIDVLFSFINEPSYTTGTKNAALKMVEKLKHPLTDNSNLYDDLYQSFLEVGLDHKNAEEHTWNVLSIYAGGASNIQTILLFYANTKNSIATLGNLLFIFSAINYLDSVYSKHKLPLYSLPSKIKTECDFGKSYHFWMTAFLARHFILQGEGSDAVKASVYLSHVGYQMESKTTGRDPFRFLILPVFDPANNKNRIDLAFAASGVEYGVLAAQNKLIDSTINLDQKILNLLKDAKDFLPMSKIDAESMNRVERHKRWLDIFSPKSALQ